MLQRPRRDFVWLTRIADHPETRYPDPSFGSHKPRTQVPKAVVIFGERYLRIGGQYVRDDNVLNACRMYPQRQDHRGWLRTLVEQFIPNTYLDPKLMYFGARLFGDCGLHRTTKARRGPTINQRAASTRFIRRSQVGISHLKGASALKLARDQVFSSATAKSSKASQPSG